MMPFYVRSSVNILVLCLIKCTNEVNEFVSGRCLFECLMFDRLWVHCTCLYFISAYGLYLLYKVAFQYFLICISILELVSGCFCLNYEASAYSSRDSQDNKSGQHNLLV